MLCPRSLWRQSSLFLWELRSFLSRLMGRDPPALQGVCGMTQYSPISVLITSEKHLHGSL